MQPPAARPAWAWWRLAAVAVVCVAAALLVHASTANGAPGAAPSPRTLPSRLVVRDAYGGDAGEGGAPPEASVRYDRGDSAALVDAFLARGGRVVAVIFFGRRRYTAVQWPYLLAARRSEGTGLLDQVIYVANTRDKDDLAWLDQLQAAHADYVMRLQPERVVLQGQNNADYCALYREIGSSSDTLEESNTLVIKIDDDVVYIAPDALRNLVAAKLRSEHLLFVSANVVNHPLLAHVHQRVGLLEPTDVERVIAAPQESQIEDLALLPESWNFGYSTFSGDGWHSGAHALLQHRLLLHRLNSLGEAGASALYDAFRLWDFDAQGFGTGRWSINCFVYDPADLASMDVELCRNSQDDENFLSNVFPATTGKHCGATADALVAHMAYYPQREWLEEHASVMQDYAALAQRVAHAGQH